MNSQEPANNAGINSRQLDELLRTSHSVKPPTDFVATVMQGISEQPAPATSPGKPLHTWWQWLALLVAGSPGIAQAFALIFSVWQVSSAG